MSASASATSHQSGTICSLDLLLTILRAAPRGERTIVLVSRIRDCDFMALLLASHGVAVTNVHGLRYAPQRYAAVHTFNSGSVVMVCTQVAWPAFHADHVIVMGEEGEMDAYDDFVQAHTFPGAQVTKIIH